MTNWVDNLPFILSTLRKTLKEDLGCSVAELIFSTPLSLSMQYFSPTKDSITNFAQELQHKIVKMAYTPLRHQSTDMYVPHLQECKFVFVRNDAVKCFLVPK